MRTLRTGIEHLPGGQPASIPGIEESARRPLSRRERRLPFLGALVATFLIGRLIYQILQPQFAPSSFLDEILIVSVGIFAPLGILVLFKSSEGQRIFLLVSAYFLIILLSSLVSGYSFERGADVFYISLALDMKFFALLFGVYALSIRCVKSGDSQLVVRIIMSTLVVVALINSFQVIRDITGNGLGLNGDPLGIRGGFFRPNGFFHHPVASAQVTLFGFIASLGFLARGYTLKAFGAASFLFLILIAHVSAKEIVVGCLCLAMFMLLYVRNDAFTRFIAALMAGVAVASVLASPIGGQVTDRISYYMGDEGTQSVRRALYSGSVAVASDLMPLGSGVGTFGSQGSRMNGYSSLYFTHGVYGLWGATAQNDRFLLDTFWPKVIAEAGVLGLVIFTLLTLILVRAAWRMMAATKSPEDFVIFSGVIGILIISVATAALGEEFLGSLFYIFSGIALARTSLLRRRSRTSSAQRPVPTSTMPLYGRRRY